MFEGLAPMHTPVHASVEDIGLTSYCNACSFFTLRQSFGDSDGGSRQPQTCAIVYESSVIATIVLCGTKLTIKCIHFLMYSAV